MTREDNKYEDIIKKYDFEQLIYEMSIINKRYKPIYAQKKALEEECDRRLNEKRGN